MIQEYEDKITLILFKMIMNFKEDKNNSLKYIPEFDSQTGTKSLRNFVK